MRAPPDYAAVAERRLLQRGVPGLREIWHDADWRCGRCPTPARRGITRSAASRSRRCAVAAANGALDAVVDCSGGLRQPRPGGWTDVAARGPGGRIHVRAG